MIDKVKLALRVSTSAFDSEIEGLIAAGRRDLELAGVLVADDDPLIIRAIITYCRVHFGSPDDFDRLKLSYDEQKAQMSMATGYTNWGDVVG